MIVPKLRLAAANELVHQRMDTRKIDCQFPTANVGQQALDYPI